MRHLSPAQVAARWVADRNLDRSLIDDHLKREKELEERQRG